MGADHDTISHSSNVNIIIGLRPYRVFFPPSREKHVFHFPQYLLQSALFHSVSIEDQDGSCKIEDLCIQYEATRSSFDIEDRTGGD